MPTIPYKHALLMKRTAWRNMQPRAPRDEDARFVPTAIRMLTCIACLNYAMCDLEEELTAAGLWRHAVKHAFVTVQNQAQRVHQQAYEMLSKANAQAARQYNDKLEEGWLDIETCVALKAPERAYNIVVALCRLIEKLNNDLTGRYDFAPARVLYRIPEMLAGVKIHDYHIDRIIELNLQ